MGYVFGRGTPSAGNRYLRTHSAHAHLAPFSSGGQPRLAPGFLQYRLQTIITGSNPPSALVKY